jgi:hypothetical protein
MLGAWHGEGGEGREGELHKAIDGMPEKKTGMGALYWTVIVIRSNYCVCM